MENKNVKTRFDLKVKCTTEELDSIRLIRNKFQCAAAAINPANIPGGCDEEKVKVFIKAALASKAEAMFLEDDWWRRMIGYYDLPANTFLDFGTGNFFILKDNPGEPV